MRVALKQGGGVMERQHKVFVRDDTQVDIVLMRSCLVMSCPAAGDALGCGCGGGGSDGE